MTNKTGKMTSGSRSHSAYLELLKTFPPRPINSEEELLATQNIIDSLIDRGTLTADEKDYLNVLGSLVYEYEQKYESMPDIHGVELLKALLDELGLRQKDLVAIFKTESIVSAVLNGQRQLTVDHIRKLAEFFHISPATFFESFIEANAVEVSVTSQKSSLQQRSAIDILDELPGQRLSKTPEEVDQYLQEERSTWEN
ncbi:MAG: helix-turn-helix domain-containing protein [Coleofasciculaceae cyanobacterium]